MPHRRLTAAHRGGSPAAAASELPPSQLAFVVEILAAHVRAGRSLRHALADAVADLPEPAAGRVAAAAADAALARPRGRGAGAPSAPGATSPTWWRRCGCRSGPGGDLALLLDRTAELLHDRAAQRRAAEVATAQARATGRIVTAMPALGVAALYVADRPGFDLLVRSPLGWLALAASAGLAALGHALISRLSEVDP